MIDCSDESLATRALTLGPLLMRKRRMLATAESCTGGWIAQTVTAIAGSSDWFDRGFVTYSNQAKMDMLGVREKTLDAHGAVSAETAAEMAAGALARAGVELAVAVTGVAGPGGGSAAKPVGTVWFGWCLDGNEPLTRCHCFDGDRESVRRQTVALALDGLFELLDGVPDRG